MGPFVLGSRGHSGWCFLSTNLHQGPGGDLSLSDPAPLLDLCLSQPGAAPVVGMKMKKQDLKQNTSLAGFDSEQLC